MVGNSSSGLIEVPSFAKGTINIGDRQRGRLKADSVVDCNPHRKSIINALQHLYSDTFLKKLQDVHNHYGEGAASKKIVKILQDHPLESILKKPFHNLDL